MRPFQGRWKHHTKYVCLDTAKIQTEVDVKLMASAGNAPTQLKLEVVDLIPITFNQRHTMCLHTAKHLMPFYSWCVSVPRVSAPWRHEEEGDVEGGLVLPWNNAFHCRVQLINSLSVSASVQLADVKPQYYLNTSKRCKRGGRRQQKMFY